MWIGTCVWQKSGECLAFHSSENYAIFQEKLNSSFMFHPLFFQPGFLRIFFSQTGGGGGVFFFNRLLETESFLLKLILNDSWAHYQMKNIMLISSITDEKKNECMNGIHSVAFVDRCPQSITETHAKSPRDISEGSKLISSIRKWSCCVFFSFCVTFLINRNEELHISRAFCTRNLSVALTHIEVSRQGSFGVTWKTWTEQQNFLASIRGFQEESDKYVNHAQTWGVLQTISILGPLFSRRGAAVNFRA